MSTVLIAIIVLIAIYFYFTRTFDYWAERGVKHDKPALLFGANMKYLLRDDVSSVATATYKKYPNEQLVGIFRGNRPELIIRDPGLAKIILVHDFSIFHRRGFDSSNLEPLLKNIAFADDDLWRQLRLRTTPAFSSGKIKAMFPIIVQRAERLQTLMRTMATADQAIDAKDLMARFTSDVIGSIGFGIISDSLTNGDDAVRQLGTKILSMTFSRALKHVLKSLMPSIFSHLKILGDVEEEVIEVVRSVMRQRNFEPSGRHDFIDLLLEYRKEGGMTGNSMIAKNADGSPKNVSIELDDGVMAAQCFLFFTAGFESSSSAMSYTLHELAHNPDIQKKVQEEIDCVLASHDNKLSYDAISKMTYLRWCFNESLRIVPIGAAVKRQSVQQFTFPGTNVTIDAGVSVIIPLEAYQNDSDIFPEPQEFRPERFDPAVMTAQQKLAYLPFGDGPRGCIGERLGVMQSMVGLAAVLAQCSVQPVPNAPRRRFVTPVFDVFTQLKGPLPLIFQKRMRF